jgi:tripartite-type tricarboxylate transporter receptor subunit TctC
MKAGTTMLRRRSALSMLAAALAHHQAQAQTDASWPSRPVRLLVGFAPGGTADILARKLQAPLSQRLGQSVLVENRTGASGTIAASEVARSGNDGHTFGLVVSTHASLASVSRRLPFDTERDFAPVVFIGSIPLVLLVGRDQPFQTFAEFIAAARARPGALNYGMPGTGLSHHFAGEMLKQRAQVDITAVSYRGTAPALTDVIAGQVQMTFGTLPAVMGAIRGGTVRPLAITALKRAASLPDVPTIAESGYPDFEMAEWFGIVAPATAPASVVQRMNAEVNAVLEEPDLREWMQQNAVSRGTTTSEGFRLLIGAEIAKLTKIAQTAGISLD